MLSLTGDVPDARAARFAEKAGDVVQVTRIDPHCSHHLLADARFADAAHTAGRAVRSAESAGPPSMLAVALCNEGAALMRLCRYSDAVERYERVLSLAQRMGSEWRAGALAGLGEVYRRQSAYEQARGAYEEAVRISRDGADGQTLVRSLVGLARLLVCEDIMEASALAKEAMATARGSGVIPALLAAGHAAVARGEHGEAADLASHAVKRARRRRERAWLAEALELRADTEGDLAKRRATLAEAYGIWHDGGAAHDADRVLVTLGRLTNAHADDRLQAMLAAERLAAAGVVDSLVGGPGPHKPGLTGPTQAGQVAIQTFGRFEVFVDGRLAPASAWKSRKARDLLRILVARRGRVVPRLELCELLWPDDEPLRTAHRLSVLLSIVRTVSGQDILIADPACVALDLTRVRVDVEDFLDDVAHGFRLRTRGAVAEARSVLAAAERRYVGEPFEDDPYADWAAPLREEARGTYLRAVRLLTDLTRADGDREQAASYLRLLLLADPYDEAAHRMLVTIQVDGGRHGEARRTFARYGAAMAAIGVRPPDKAILSA